MGVPPVELKIIGDVDETITEPDGTQITHRFKEVQIIGEPPKIAGWQFVGTLEPLPSGDNLLKSVPGQVLPERFRTTGTYCDHCKSHRKRLETFVVKNDKDEYQQVGRQCLKDFLGHDPEKVVKWFEWLHKALHIARSATSGVGERTYNVSEYLQYVAEYIKEYGWMSSSAWKRLEYQSLEVQGSVKPTWSGAYYQFMSSKPISPEAKDVAIKAREWAIKVLPTKPFRDDKERMFIRNKIDVVKNDFVKHGHMKYAALVIWDYLKSIDSDWLRHRWVGQKDLPIEIYLRFNELRQGRSAGGRPWNLYKFTDVYGNDVSWFSGTYQTKSEGRDLIAGKWYYVKGIVSAHNNWGTQLKDWELRDTNPGLRPYDPEIWGNDNPEPKIVNLGHEMKLSSLRTDIVKSFTEHEKALHHIEDALHWLEFEYSMSHIKPEIRKASNICAISKIDGKITKSKVISVMEQLNTVKDILGKVIVMMKTKQGDVVSELKKAAKIDIDIDPLYHRAESIEKEGGMFSKIYDNPQDKSLSIDKLAITYGIDPNVIKQKFESNIKIFNLNASDNIIGYNDVWQEIIKDDYLMKHRIYEVFDTSDWEPEDIEYFVNGILRNAEWFKKFSKNAQKVLLEIAIWVIALRKLQTSTNPGAMFSKDTPEWLKKEYEFNPPLGEFKFVIGENPKGQTIYNISTPIDDNDPLGGEWDVTPGFLTFDELHEFWYENGETILGEWIKQPDREHFQNAIENFLNQIGYGGKPEWAENHGHKPVSFNIMGSEIFTINDQGNYVTLMDGRNVPYGSLDKEEMEIVNDFREYEKAVELEIESRMEGMENPKNSVDIWREKIKSRLKAASYEERKGGFSCSSCQFFIQKRYFSYCSHPKIKADVKPFGCCCYWKGDSSYKANPMLYKPQENMKIAIDTTHRPQVRAQLSEGEFKTIMPMLGWEADLAISGDEHNHPRVVRVGHRLDFIGELDEYVWTCPVCRKIFKDKKQPKLADIKKKHMTVHEKQWQKEEYSAKNPENMFTEMTNDELIAAYDYYLKSEIPPELESEIERRGIDLGFDENPSDWNIYDLYDTPDVIRKSKEVTKKITAMIRNGESYNDIKQYLTKIKGIGATDTVTTDIIAVLIKARDGRVPGQSVTSPTKKDKELLHKIMKGKVDENPKRMEYYDIGNKVVITKPIQANYGKTLMPGEYAIAGTGGTDKIVLLALLPYDMYHPKVGDYGKPIEEVSSTDIANAPRLYTDIFNENFQWRKDKWVQKLETKWERKSNKDIKFLETALWKGQMTPYLHEALEEIVAALELGYLKEAANLTAVKSYICNLTLPNSGFIEDCPFAEDGKFNEKELGESLYRFLDGLHFALARETKTIPAGSIALDAHGGKTERPKVISDTSPTFQRMHEQDLLLDKRNTELWKKL